MPDLRLCGLCCSYGNHAVVNDVNLDIADREFVALLGPSGCGKTTTLRLVAGFAEPTAGTIASEGRELSRPGKVVPPEQRGIAMIFQSYAIWPHMTVADNVGFGLRLRKLPRAEIAKKVAAMLASVHLDGLAARYPSELSGGQQQRVALARALVIEPKVLLLDEPLSNLDVHLREELRQEIRRLHDLCGTTTVYVTHDQAEAMSTADRVVLMNRGRIEQIDAPHDLYMKPKTRFAAEFIGKTNILQGRVRGDEVAFPGFAIPLVGKARTSDALFFSLRPESVLINTPGAPTAFALKMRLMAKTYRGDHWDYSLCTDAGDLTLRAVVPPSAYDAVGAEVDAAIDPQALSLIEA
jgi:iron(III) transport system ATP-binding protein